MVSFNLSYLRRTAGPHTVTVRSGLQHNFQRPSPALHAGQFFPRNLLVVEKTTETHRQTGTLLQRQKSTFVMWLLNLALLSTDLSPEPLKFKGFKNPSVTLLSEVQSNHQ